MKKKNVVVVAAHPDDEILGCGGSIAKFAAEGHNVYVVIAAEGLTSRGGPASGAMDDLHRICEEANKALGVKEVEFLRMPDNRMDSVDFLEVVKKIEKCFQKFKPDVVLTHHHSDLNVDHRICHMAVLTAARPLPDGSVKQILFFEVLSATEWIFSGSARSAFTPNYFVDIDKYLSQKLKALEKYESEMRPFPHARSLEGCEHLARWRGCTVGVKAAEAFELGRMME